MNDATKSQSGCHHRPALLLLALVLAGPAAPAARWVLPAETRVRVEIVNPTADSLEAYRKDFTRGPQSVVTEAAIALPARATRVIDASVGDQVSVLDVPAAGAVRVRGFDERGRAFALGAGQSNHLYFPARASRNSGELVITNLSSQSQDGRILSRKPGEDGLELRRFRIGGREALKLDPAGFSGTAFAIESVFNLQAHVKTAPDATPEFAELRPNPRALPAPAGRYFVVADSGRSAAYLVDLTDPAMIAEARRQLREPDVYHPRILIAEIGVNAVGDNRNWDDKTRHPWSWRIATPLRFAALASQACDGHPQQLEDQLEAWLSGAYTGGRPVICFWGYQVVEELP